jgi:hypothetical protein
MAPAVRPSLRTNHVADDDRSPRDPAALVADLERIEQGYRDELPALRLQLVDALFDIVYAQRAVAQLRAWRQELRCDLDAGTMRVLDSQVDQRQRTSWRSSR